MSSSEDESISSTVESDQDDTVESDQDDTVNVIEQRVETPKEIEMSCLVVGLSFHPQKDLIAVGTIEGRVVLYSYGQDTGNVELMTFDHHKKACRAVVFDKTGQNLFIGTKDSTIQVIDLETNSVSRKFNRSSGAPLYSLLPIDDYLLASGDDDGEIVIWDFRKQTPVVCFDECNEYISSMAINSEKKVLLATCGEGTLSAFNIRSRKMELQSELFDAEFLSLGIIQKEKKVVVGSGDGSLNIFNWGEWGNISDRFPGHPSSIDCMAVINDDVICTGCDDGKIRAVQLYPHRFLGVLGNHSGFPIECMTVSGDNNLIATSSYDQKIKFWDVTCLDLIKTHPVVKSRKKNKNKLLNSDGNDFFSGLA